MSRNSKTSGKSFFISIVVISDVSNRISCLWLGVNLLWLFSLRITKLLSYALRHKLNERIKNCSSTCIQVFTRTHPQFDRFKGHVRDPSSNSMLLLTSSIIVPGFIILRRRVNELSRKRTDAQTDIQDDRIKCSGEHIIIYFLRGVLNNFYHPCRVF